MRSCLAFHVPRMERPCEVLVTRHRASRDLSCPLPREGKGSLELSTSDCVENMSSRQETSAPSGEINQQDRFYSAWASVGELIVLILTCAAAKMIGKRLSLLAEGGWLPGQGDARTIAALTNRPESSIAEVTSNTPRHKYHAGRQVFYRLSDFAIPAPPADRPPTDAPVKRSGRNK